MAKHAPQTSDRSRLEQEIDENLRRAFDDVASEPLPDKFASLLARLRTAGAARTPAGEDAQ